MKTQLIQSSHKVIDNLGTLLGVLLKYCDRKNQVVLALETWLNDYLKKPNQSQSALPVLLSCFCTLCIRSANPLEKLILMSESIHSVIEHTPTQDQSPVFITEGNYEEMSSE